MTEVLTDELLENEDDEIDDGDQLQDVQVAGGEGLAGKEPAKETLASFYVCYTFH